MFGSLVYTVWPSTQVQQLDFIKRKNSVLHSFFSIFFSVFFGSSQNQIQSNIM